MPPKPTERPELSANLEVMGSRLDSVEFSVADLKKEQSLMHQSLLQEIQRLATKLSSSSVSSSSQGDGSPSLPPTAERASEQHTRVAPFDAVRESYDEFCLSVKKVELPGFTSVDPVGWISRAKTYFEVHNTSDEMKIKLARLCMEGSTIHWFNLVRESEEHLSWDSFKRVFILHFTGSIYDNPYEELKMIHQTGSVTEYIEHFELVSSQISKLTESQYIGMFMGGMRSEIRQRVHTLRPTSRWTVMQVARDVEMELGGPVVPGFSVSGVGRSVWPPSIFSPISKGSASSVSIGPLSSSRSFQTSSAASSLPTSQVLRPTSSVQSMTSPPLAASVQRRDTIDRKGVPDRSHGVSHISHQEYLDRRSKGLCFKCGDRFTPLHQCPSKSLRLLLLGDDNPGSDSSELEAIVGDDGDEATVMDCSTISLMGVVKFEHPNSNTFRIRGIVGEKVTLNGLQTKGEQDKMVQRDCCKT